jgi:hypothetical protein
VCVDIEETFVITDPSVTDFGCNVQNMVVYSCGFLEMLRH